ncbi:MAG TPA: ABC transporter permease, partial [Geminicoccaceae bacterium]|nr:ABC transporter permease [Geminicoccaceae bacterium]
MLRFIARRLTVVLPTLLLVSIFVFGLQQLLPGDPAEALAGQERDPEVIAFLREKYRLNEPVHVQYAYWLGSVLRGDLGTSIRARLPIGEMIVDKLPITIQLGVMSMLVAVCIGIPAGIVSAVRRGTAWDYGANVVALSGLSIPNFWLGIMLILVFAVQLGWLPSGGYVSPFADLGANLRGMLLPALVLGTGNAAVLMRHTRGAMLGVLRQDYVRPARAKGVAERRVVLKHALRNALIPVVTLGTLQFGELLAGAVLTEQVFSIP